MTKNSKLSAMKSKSNRKRPKVAKSTSDEQEDRLTSLPDSIICHILSFLGSTKYAAMTSVLSKRWRYLFLGVSIIDLRKVNHKNHDFNNIVNQRLMLCRTSSITEFRLSFKKLPEVAVINLWLTELFFCKVQVLELLDYSQGSSPPCSLSGIFRLETLVVLKLVGSNFVLEIPEFVSFPNLKVLHFNSLKIQYESESFRLAGGYPLLEDLRLDQITFLTKNDNDPILEISMRTLKKLAIGESELCGFSRIDIDTPHLQHLECDLAYCLVPVTQINCCKFESLVSAVISLISEWQVEGQSRQTIRFVSKLNNVKELNLTVIHLEDYSGIANSFPQFPNLTRLELNYSKLMWILLQHAPNVEVLDCNMEFRDECLLPQENVPLCVAQTLREIEIVCYIMDSGIFEAVGFFLQHGAVLKRMHIFCIVTVNKRSTLRRLLKLKRLSPKCEVELEYG